jgi:NDP-hexose-3-ketoreductase
VSAALFFGLDDTYRNAYELHGTRGTLRLDRVFTPLEKHEPVILIDGAGGHREIGLAPADQFAEAFRAFADAVIGRTTRDATRDDLLVRQAALVEAVRGTPHAMR